MRDAADTLEEVGERYGYLFPEDAEWSAERLRNEVQHVETEEREEAKIIVLIERLAVELFTANNEHYQRAADPLWFASVRDDYLDIARILVRDHNWRNED